MSDQNDFEQRLPAIQAISAKDTKTSNIPIGIYVQEAENLYYWALKDSEQLAGAGLQSDILSELAARIGVLREAEGRWQAEYRAHQTAQEQWAKEGPKAFALRDDLLRSFRYAFRNDESLLRRLTIIDEGNSNADMIQDLNSLAALGRDFLEQLNAINFDPALLDEAASAANSLSQLLAQANGETLSGKQQRIQRDQAYTYLKTIVDEVRACGKYVFHQNDARLVGYISQYGRRSNRQRATTAAQPETDNAA